MAAVYVHAGLQVPDQDFRAGAAVAVRLVMVQRDPVIRAHIVQPVAHVRKDGPSDADSADVRRFFLPWDAVIEQALFQLLDFRLEGGHPGQSELQWQG